MAQFSYTTINPATTSGIQLADILSRWMDAERSGSSGADHLRIDLAAADVPDRQDLV